MTSTFRIARDVKRLRRASGRMVAVALLPLALVGCKHFDQGSKVAGWVVVEPQQRHPIIVSQQPAHLNLHVARGSQGLTPSQRAEVAEFAARFRAGDAGNSRLVISAPSGADNEVAAMNAVDDIRGLLLEGGFNEALIAVEAYHEEGRRSAPVRISYMSFVAEGPDCGHDWSENLATSRKNIAHPNFGCTAQHNLAAMIANPADLLGPRSESPRDGARRDDVFGKWTKGETTGADKSEDERVRVRGAN
ncbi:MAG: CpaD family pilus assembly protein [Hyphomicrobium sp.]